jgi:alpha-glucosidase (family GH31 glycosyl hydrolase)
MFGDSLLVAPVFHETTAQYYLPAGRWTDFWTDKVVVGPKWVTEKDYPLNSIPVFVKENSVILLGPEDVKIPDYAYDQVELEVRAYEISGDVSVDVPTGKGNKLAGAIKVSKNGVEAGSFKVTDKRSVM